MISSPAKNGFVAGGGGLPVGDARRTPGEQAIRIGLRLGRPVDLIVGSTGFARRGVYFWTDAGSDECLVPWSEQSISEGRTMVDRLRRSSNKVEPPVCADCNLEMTWFQSMLVAEDQAAIAHLFSCPNCGRVTETRSVISDNGFPLQKLCARPSVSYSLSLPGRRPQARRQRR